MCSTSVSSHVWKAFRGSLMEMTTSVADIIKFQFELERVAFKYNKTLKWSCSREENTWGKNKSKTEWGSLRMAKITKDCKSVTKKLAYFFKIRKLLAFWKSVEISSIVWWMKCFLLLLLLSSSSSSLLLLYYNNNNNNNNIILSFFFHLSRSPDLTYLSFQLLFSFLILIIL